MVTGQLKPVLDTLVTLRKMGKWTEIVYLVLPTLNDSDAEFRGLAQWIKANLGADVPLHFTQYHPEYLLKNLPITPVATLERAKAIADAEGLHFVYIGNVPGHPAQNTYCPKCRKMIVERVGFVASEMLIKNGNCPFCQQPIPGVWHVMSRGGCADEHPDEPAYLLAGRAAAGAADLYAAWARPRRAASRRCGRRPLQAAFIRPIRRNFRR